MSGQVVRFDAIALDAWRVRLDAERGEATDRILAFAKGCYEFAEHCERKGVGTVYTVKMLEWFEIEQGTASKWRVLGSNYQAFVATNVRLPPSMETIYLLCNVPTTVIATQVTPKTTQHEAQELKRRYRKGTREGWTETLFKARPEFFSDAERRDIQVNGPVRNALRAVVGTEVLPAKGYVKTDEERAVLVARFDQVSRQLRERLDKVKHWDRGDAAEKKRMERRERDKRAKTRDPVFRKMRYRKPNREVERASWLLDGLCDVLDGIKREQLEEDKTVAWAAHFRQCVLRINRFVRRIR